MSASKNVKTLTIAEAIEQGYVHFVEEGDAQLYFLSDCVKEGKLYSELDYVTKRFFLLGKESSSYQLNETDIPEAICGHLDNQEEFNDEDMVLVGYVSDLLKEQPELFSKLKDALNEKFRETTFHPATDIELLFPK